MKLHFLIGFFLLWKTWCSGQVVINEVNLKPQSDATSSQFQSLKVCSQSSFGAEYIELYNTTCSPIDIGCWMIGYRIFSAQLDGTFRFPAGTVIGPRAFVSIGGPNSGATFNLFGFCGNPHLVTGNDRWYLDNGDCYVAFYNASGVPQDAVYWTVSAGQSSKWGTDSDLDEPPTYVPSPPGCSPVASLPGPTSAALTAVVGYAGASPALGLVVHRTSDGGPVWSNNGVPTVNATNNVANPCVLPVQLEMIEMDCTPESPTLYWRTISEENMDYFEVEYARDGQSFQRIGRIENRGGADFGAEYRYSFGNGLGLAGLSRLRQVDLNGVVSYSPAVESNCSSIRKDIVMRQGKLYSQFGLENISCQIFSLSGKLLFSGNASNCALDVPNGGIYLLKVSDGSAFHCKKLINH